MHGSKLCRPPIDVAKDLMDMAREAIEAGDMLAASARYEQAARYYRMGNYHHSADYAARRAVNVLKER